VPGYFLETILRRKKKRRRKKYKKYLFFSPSTTKRGSKEEPQTLKPEVEAGCGLKTGSILKINMRMRGTFIWLPL
jgi:hypothetical protein